MVLHHSIPQFGTPKAKSEFYSILNWSMYRLLQVCPFHPSLHIALLSEVCYIQSMDFLVAPKDFK